jgi:hypothetical protein
MIIPTENTKPLTEMYAFVSIDGNGNEGICATSLPGLGWVPMVSGSPGSLAVFTEHAEKLSKESNTTIQMIKFSNPEVVKVFNPEKGH